MGIFLSIPLALLSGLIAMPLSAAEPLLVTFPEKPPYYYVHGGSARGFLLERARDVLVEAGISAVFAERPAKRALYEISASRDPVCSLGWFRNDERERFAQFSLPIHRDAPVRLLVTHARQAELRAYRSLHSLLQDTRLRLGVVEGFSYGEATDALLKAHEHKVVRAPVTVRQLMQMVAHERMDMALVDELEFTHRSADPELAHLDLATISFPDIPAGNLRHLMCGRIDAATMARINAAIIRLGYQP